MTLRCVRLAQAEADLVRLHAAPVLPAGGLGGMVVAAMLVDAATCLAEHGWRHRRHVTVSDLLTLTRAAQRHHGQDTLRPL